MGTNPVFFHVDLDAFYASVEQLDHPEFRGKPVIVGALPGRRGVVSACSYEARKFGIHSAMSGYEAHRRCPHGVFLPVRMQRYQEVSRQVMAVFSSFTPVLQQISIDEGFLDMAGTERLFGPPRSAADQLKDAVRAQTGLTVTVGIASSRYIAKLASAYDKPDGRYEVKPGEEADFVLQVPIEDLWGVGKKTLARLRALGIDSVMRLRECELPFLRGHFGESSGVYLHQVCRGIDPGIYRDAGQSHSISSETTFETDVDDPEIVHRTVLELAEHVMFRLREERMQSSTVTVKVRDHDFQTSSAQRGLKHPVSSVDELFQVAKELVAKRWNRAVPLRLIGIGVSGVTADGGEVQGSLFEDETASRRRAVEEALLQLRHKHPETPQITRARLLSNDD